MKDFIYSKYEIKRGNHWKRKDDFHKLVTFMIKWYRRESLKKAVMELFPEMRLIHQCESAKIILGTPAYNPSY